MSINRRSLLSLLGASPALLAGAAAAAQTKAKGKTAAGKAPMVGAPKIVALNPRGIPPPITLIPMAKRLDSLDGKTVYLVSDGFPGADHFLAQVGIWFQKNMPSVTTVYRLKAGGFADDDPKLNAEIKEKGQAVIMAIGH
ncbi:MAG TPA: hypothetical protein VK757_07425 [Candidatus Acidoferrum sp.]|jgi:hypothetical protein|nr:hypothetical protein [Candidatus Acidoferrum sp.]